MTSQVVIVVGAGIAGVAAAVSLHQAGHKVKIYEKSKFATEIGAALNCAPNGALALQKLGFDFTQAKGVRLENWETIDGSSLEQIRNQDISQADKNIGAPFCAIHRNDLFQGLLALAQRSDTTVHGEQRSIALILDAKVVHVDAEKGVVRFADGSTQEADLIVAADGIHSAIRPFVVDPVVDTSADTGLSAYRFLIPNALLQQSPAAQRLLARKANGVGLYVDTVNADGERHITWYACRGGELHNFVCIHPKREDAENTDILSQVLQEFGHFHSDVVEVLRLASDVRSWPLLARQPLTSWSKGKVVLIGDAAHPMLPFGGQGANQAIEDGAALGVFMRGVEATTFHEQLQAYVQFRSRRVARTQLLASVRPGNEGQVMERVKEFMEPGIPLPDVFSKRVLHDAAYDVMAEAERVVAGMGRERAP